MVRQAVTLVGHDAQCHLTLPDDALVAPQHALFEERGTGVFLSSLASEHPVERNGEPILAPVRLAHNDLLVLGQTRIQFQDVIAPHPRLRPSSGLMQPMTLAAAAAIIALELGLLVFLVDWPKHLIRPETEAADLSFAEALRASREDSTNGTGSSATTPAPKTQTSVVTLPGTAPAAERTTPPGDRSPTSSLPSTATSSAPAAILQVLDQADFTPADIDSAPVVLPPPSSAPDPLVAESQRLLAEAVSAAQFADYAKASRLLNQIHQNTPGFLPAHVEHARLLEARGDLDAAQRRWTQILGIAPEGSPVRSQAGEERQRIARLQALQSQMLRSPTTPDLANMPRHVRILTPDIQKMPADADVAEMRVLNATLELAPDGAFAKEAAIQVFVTFYDLDANDQIQVTRAIATPSPMALGHAFADRRSVPIQATYVVPRGRRSQEAHGAARPPAYYGYAVHVFAGQLLQDAVAKPKKLLERPLVFTASSSDSGEGGN